MVDLIALQAAAEPSDIDRFEVTFDPQLDVPLRVDASAAPGTYDTQFSIVINNFTETK
jgi:hypothetical protein